jgi:hypothetical protein
MMMDLQPVTLTTRRSSNPVYPLHSVKQEKKIITMRFINIINLSALRLLGLGRFFSFLIPYTQSVGLLRWGNIPR